MDTLVLHQVRLGRTVLSWQPSPERVARSRGYPPVALVKPQDAEGLYTYRVTVSACCRDTWPLPTGGDIVDQHFMPVDGDAEHIDMFVRYKLERDYINGQIEFFRTIDGQYVQVGVVALQGDRLKQGVHWAPTARVKGTPQDMPWTVITGTGY